MIFINDFLAFQFKLIYNCKKDGSKSEASSTKKKRAHNKSSNPILRDLIIACPQVV